jgi:biotin carboxylase
MPRTEHPTALILGGGQWQVPIVRRAREMGIRTVVTDRSETAPARMYADDFVQVDGTDQAGLLAVARRFAVHLIVAEGTDRHVTMAGFLNDQLGLPGITAAIAHRFTNKLAMRQALEGADVPMPRYAEVRTADEALDLGVQWGYPLVLKPKASQSSLGVFRVEKADELSRRFDTTVQYSADGAILIEEFVDGPEITVESFSLNGECYVLGVSEKEHYAHNVCVARRLAYPPRYSAELLATIERTARRVVETLGLQDGLSHAEYRVKDGVPHLVEVGARGGGNAIAATIVPHVSGIDVYALLVRRLLGEDVSMPTRRRHAGVLQFLDLAPGTISAVHGLERIEAEGLVVDIRLAFAAGDTIVAAADDTTRAGYFIALGGDRDDVDARCRRVETLLRVEYV